MRQHIKDYLPYAGAGLIVGFGLGVLLFGWVYVVTV